MSENLYEIVNGSLLRQYNGKKVQVIGSVSQLSSNGLSFEMNTVDNVNVKVILRKPWQDELTGYVEVHGEAQGTNVICEELIQFSSDDAGVFDSAGHNKLCTFLHSIPNLWRTN